MSSWVYLEKDGQTVSVEPFAEGGTYVMGGSTDAELNVTWNYGPRFVEAWDKEDFENRVVKLGWHGTLHAMLHERVASETVPLLEQAIATLSTDTDSDYWKATSGNAGHALSVLCQWAKEHPEATWRVS